jgi:hypothetical protein
MGAAPEVGMSFARADGRGPTETEVRAHEGAHRGRSPLEASFAVAAIDEATGELVERASFPQNRVGLRSFEDAGLDGSPSAVGRWRTPAASG